MALEYSSRCLELPAAVAAAAVAATSVVDSGSYRRERSGKLAVRSSYSFRSSS